MKVLLLKDCTIYQKPYKKNAVLSIKNPGYAINYLIPKGLAVVCNASNNKVAAENVRQKNMLSAKRKELAEATAYQLSRLSLELKVKADKNNRIYGSVTAIQLGTLLKSHKIEGIDSKQIEILEAEKVVETGKSYGAVVHLAEGVDAPITFSLVADMG